MINSQSQKMEHLQSKREQEETPAVKRIRHPLLRFCSDGALFSLLTAIIIDLFAIGVTLVAMPFLLIITFQASPLDISKLQLVDGALSMLSGLVTGYSIDKMTHDQLGLTIRVFCPLMNAGSAVDMGIYAYTNSIDLLYIGAAIGGIFSSTMVLLDKYAMQIFTLKEVQVVMPMVMGIFQLCLVAMPNVGAALSAVSLRLPFLVGLICAGSGAVLAAGRALLHVFKANRKAALTEMPKKDNKDSAKATPTPKFSRRRALLMIGSQLCFSFGDQCTGVTRMFLILKRTKWTQAQWAIFMTFVTIASAMVSMIVIPRLLRRFHFTHVRLVGAVVNIAVAILFPLFDSVGFLIAVRSFDVFATSLFQSARGPMVKAYFPDHVRGKMLGIVSTLQQALGIIAPIIGSVLWESSEAWPWWLGKVPICSISLVLHIVFIMEIRST